MPQIEGGVPAERAVAVGDDDGDRAAREAERLGDGAVQAPVGAGEEPAEGAADPLREPHCQTVEKDRGLRSTSRTRQKAATWRPAKAQPLHAYRFMQKATSNEAG